MENLEAEVSTQEETNTVFVRKRRVVGFKVLGFRLVYIRSAQYMNLKKTVSSLLLLLSFFLQRPPSIISYWERSENVEPKRSPC